jgi:hypothetical protein
LCLWPFRSGTAEGTREGEIVTGRGDRDWRALIAFGEAQTGRQAHQASPDPHQSRDRALRCGKTLDGDGPGSS